MQATIEVKIKMKNGKEVVLNEDEAKELLAKLKEIFPDPVVNLPSFPIIIEKPYPCKPYWQEPWYSADGNVKMYTVNNT